MLLPQQLKGSIDEVLSNEVKEDKAINRRIFLTILENISFLARQGLALRGHDDFESNFHQLLLLRSNDSRHIIEWLKKKTNKYTGHDIQNECLQLLSLQIVRDISRKIRSSSYFTVMADECTDVSNKEQFTICMRWVDENLDDHEDFIGLYQVDNIDACTLTDAIN